MAKRPTRKAARRTLQEAARTGIIDESYRFGPPGEPVYRAPQQVSPNDALGGYSIEEAIAIMVPARLFNQYMRVLDGAVGGDKNPQVIEWCRENFTPEEFKHKYEHRNIK